MSTAGCAISLGRRRRPTDWAKPVTDGFNPAAEIVKDGEDAVVRLELPGVDVDKDASVAASASYDAGVLTVRVAGAYAGTQPRRVEISK